MARAYGSSAHLLMKRETTYGQAAAGNYIVAAIMAVGRAIVAQDEPEPE